MSICVICGMELDNFSQYQKHKLEWHKVKVKPWVMVRPKIKPINTSGYTKLQIVLQAESTWLKEYLI